MDLELTDKVAVVTGASKGIGLAVTRELAAEGAPCGRRRAHHRVAPRRARTWVMRARWQGRFYDDEAGPKPSYPEEWKCR
jgi:NAD(P)-dependent dehydrogenase (short-subunit alcohol dehydrogenase family)